MRTKLALAGLLAVAAVVVGCSGGSIPKPAGVASEETDGSGTRLIAVDQANQAIHGYDPVAYFTVGEAKPGSDEFTTEWAGATWRFAMAEHKAAFEADPEKYAPQYGGYCAWGVAAKNDLFDVDPNAWRVVDGKLYLNYNAEVQSSWVEDIPGFITKGDQNWPTLSDSKAG